MDLNYSAEELAFRDEVRAWLAGNLPEDLKKKVDRYEHLSKQDLLRWHRILAGRGWGAPARPKEWGAAGAGGTSSLWGGASAPAAPPRSPRSGRRCAPRFRFDSAPGAQKQRFL